MINPKNSLEGIQPLQGLKILDFTRHLPGPYATFLLASLGAEVIKVEMPNGDPARKFPSLFHLINRGKKSIMIDYRNQKGQEILKTLCKEVDFVIEGFKPGVMKNFHLNFEELRKFNPSLIYCSLSGYGQTGAYQDFPGHDLNYQALTGMAHMQRLANGEPRGTIVPVADLTGAMNAVSSLLAALYYREKTGKGTYLDINLTDLLFSWTSVWYESIAPETISVNSSWKRVKKFILNQKKAQTTSDIKISSLKKVVDQPWATKIVHTLDQWFEQSSIKERIERKRLYFLPYYSIYKTKDDQYLSLGIVDEEKFWKKLCDQLQLQRWSNVGLPTRILFFPWIRTLIQNRLRKKTAMEWINEFELTEIPIMLVKSPRDALTDEHLIQRSVVKNGTLHAPLAFFPKEFSPAPSLGEHTDAILQSLDH